MPENYTENPSEFRAAGVLVAKAVLGLADQIKARTGADPLSRKGRQTLSEQAGA